MSKTDYIKNTRLPTISSEFLEVSRSTLHKNVYFLIETKYLYDNTLFTPFVFVESAMDIENIHAASSRDNDLRISGSYDIREPKATLSKTVQGTSSQDRYGFLVKVRKSV